MNCMLYTVLTHNYAKVNMQLVLSYWSTPWCREIGMLRKLSRIISTLYVMSCTFMHIDWGELSWLYVHVCMYELVDLICHSLNCEHVVNLASNTGAEEGEKSAWYPLRTRCKPRTEKNLQERGILVLNLRTSTLEASPPPPPPPPIGGEHDRYRLWNSK